MTPKLINPLKILVLSIIIGLMVASLVSAKEERALSFSKTATETSPNEGYTVIPAKENHFIDGNFVSLLSLPSLQKGQTKYYYANVGYGAKSLEMDLNWGDSSDSMTLTYYPPSGNAYGPYYDSIDGYLNGRIHVFIYPTSGGYIGPGSWMFKVYGDKVYGKEDYSFSTATH